MKNVEKSVEKKLSACSIEILMFFVIVFVCLFFFFFNSARHRGAIIWNAVSIHFMGQCTDLCRKVKKDVYF